MNYLGSAVSDIGIVKKTNQDSACLKVANTLNHGQIALVIICDGMGGLAKGEVASATVIQAFSDWFEKELPNELLQFSMDRIRERWQVMIENLNKRLIEYGKKSGANLGTTLTAMLCVDDRYLIGHVGDSRAYLVSNGVTQLTGDQTFIAREIASGNMTPEQAKTDPRRNMLLQCVGASREVKPEFYMGAVEKDVVYMLCSDGFRHVITEDEMFQYFNRNVATSMEQMAANSRCLVDLVKSRNERDNISVALLRTY